METDSFSWNQYHPNDFFHGLLSAHCSDETGSKSGSSKVKAFDRVSFNDKHSILKHFKITRNINLNILLRDWSVLEVVECTQSGYLGIIYMNEQTKQLVLAHRSTNYKLGLASKNLFLQSGVQAEIQTVVMGEISLHQANGYVATQKAVQKAREIRYALSFTGHSLGAYLAELSVFYCHTDLDFDNTKAITFDGPGSYEMMELLSANQIQGNDYFKPENLDIVSYLNPPNIINCANTHIGTVYRLFPKLKELISWKIIQPINATIGHDMNNILPYFDIESGKPFEYQQVIKWPAIHHKEYGQNRDISNDLNKGKMAYKVVRRIYKGILGVLYQQKQLSQRLFINDQSTIVSVGNFLYDYFYRGVIDDRQFWLVQKFLDQKDSYHLNKNIRDITDQSTNQDIIEKFGLQYMARYQVTLVNIHKKLAKDRVDKYLKELKPLEMKLFSQCLSVGLSHSLNEIVIHYNYNKVKNSIIIKPTSKHLMTIDKLRDQVRYQIHHNQDEIDAFLQNNDMVKMPLISIQVEEREELYIKRVKRAHYIELINNAFFNENADIVIIKGLPGCGKTVLAEEYSKRREFIPKLFFAESEQILQQKYLEFGQQLDLDLSNQDFKMAIQMINNKIYSCGQQFLFIYDNVISSEYMQDYLINQPRNVKIIITTRDDHLLNKNNFKQVEIQISEFSSEEALECIEQNIQDVSDEDKQRIIKLSNRIPQHLKLIIGYLNHKTNVFKPIKELINQYIIDSRDNNNIFTITLNFIQDQYPQAFQILKLLSWLNPDSISIKTVVMELIEQAEDQIYNSLLILEKFSLIEISGPRMNKQIKIHRVTQKEIIKYNTGLDLLQLLLNIDCIFPLVLSDEEENDGIAIELQKHCIQILKYCDYRELLDSLVSQQRTCLQQFKAKILLKIGMVNMHSHIQFKYDDETFKVCIALSKELNIIQNILYCLIGLITLENNYNNNHEKALSYCQEVGIFLLQNMQILNEQDIALAYINIAITYHHLKNYEESLRYAYLCLEIQQKIYYTNDVRFADTYNALGFIYNQLNLQLKQKESFNEALKYYQQALDIHKKAGIKNMQTALIFNNIGELYKERGDIDTAITFFKNAIKIATDCGKTNCMKMGLLWSNLAKCYKINQKNQKEFKIREQILNLYQNIFISDDSRIANALFNVARLQQTPEKQLEFHYKALEMRKKIYAHDNYNKKIIKSKRIIGEIHYQVKNYNESVIMFEKLLTILINQSLERGISNQLIEMYARLAQLFKEMDDLDRFIEYYKIVMLLSIQTTNKEYFTEALQQLQNLLKDPIDIIKLGNAEYVNNIIQTIMKNNTGRTIITKRSPLSLNLFQIKEKIGKERLTKIFKVARHNKWKGDIFGLLQNGVRNFFEDKYWIKKLKELNTPENVKLAKLICFEYINLALMFDEGKNIAIVKKIAKSYPLLINDAIALYPQFFIDGFIVKEFISDQRMIQDILGRNQFRIEPDIDDFVSEFVRDESKRNTYISDNKSELVKLENFRHSIIERYVNFEDTGDFNEDDGQEEEKTEGDWTGKSSRRTL